MLGCMTVRITETDEGFSKMFTSRKFLFFVSYFMLPKIFCIFKYFDPLPTSVHFLSNMFIINDSSQS